MIDVTLENFETEVIAASHQVPVLVDFWAPWCGPCKTLGPLLEKVEADYGGRFKLVKIDSDQEQQLAQAFGIPTFPVDTHIHRLAARWGLSDGSNVVRTERDLKRLYAPEHWNALHLQIIYFGREHCPALRHDPARCPICSWSCAAARKRVQRVERGP